MRAALAFLTVVGRPARPTPRALRWFPVVGAFVGGVVGGVWWLAGQAFPALLAAALAVAADLAVTGLLHLDGLADAADGLLAPAVDRARRLAIMRTPGVGAFGVAVLAGTLLVRVAALGARPADVGLVVGLWCASRTVVAVAPAWVPYARDTGLASPLLDAPASPLVGLALAPAAALATATAGWVGAAAVGAAVLAAGLVLGFAWRRVGGFTGDVLGAAIVLAETVGLVVAAARW